MLDCEALALRAGVLALLALLTSPLNTNLTLHDADSLDLLKL